MDGMDGMDIHSMDLIHTETYLVQDAFIRYD
eukprot:COSAG05_NODE_1049_length_6033_cov_7.763566_1_plen_31_part_00